MKSIFNTDPIFAYAFRPLFALLALHGMLVIPYWALAWSGQLPLPGIVANPALWHGHEMLFGFSTAAIAGFLLTAVANWTQRPPIAGTPLQLLCGLWLAARLAWCWPDPRALPIAATLDIAFDGLLLILFARELIVSNNRRNFKVAAILLCYTSINAGFYFALCSGISNPTRWLQAALYLVIFLITIIGGRIIPLFTGNWLRQQTTKDDPPPPLPAPFNRFDLIAALVTAMFMVMALANWPGAGIIGIIAGLLQAIRVARWQGWRTAREPLLWSLHLGYAWLAVGLVLSGAAYFGEVSSSAGLHALTTGAIGGLILAVSGRVALGHTGRPLTSHPLLTSAIVLINTAAAARVLAALFPATPVLLWMAAGAWFFALFAYGVRYFPILLAPSVSEKD